MDLYARQQWNILRTAAASASSGALAAIEVPSGAIQHTFAVAFSTLATSNSLTLQSAQYSTGPWVAEASTQLSTAISTALVMHITGPIGPFVRPYFGTASSGGYDLFYIAVG